MDMNWIIDALNGSKLSFKLAGVKKSDGKHWRIKKLKLEANPSLFPSFPFTPCPSFTPPFYSPLLSPFPFPSSPFLISTFLPLVQLAVQGERCKRPSGGVRSGAPASNELLTISNLENMSVDNRFCNPYTHSQTKRCEISVKCVLYS